LSKVFALIVARPNSRGVPVLRTPFAARALHKHSWAVIEWLLLVGRARSAKSSTLF